MATTAAPAKPLFGSSVKRREDPRLITGRGQFTDDVKLPGTTYAAFVRSPHAHARIVRIDASAALTRPGVHAVFTGQQLKDAGVGLIPTAWFLPDLKFGDRRPLAVEHARFVGDAVAVVIADDAYTARDAAELVMVDYEALPAAVQAEEALKPGAPVVHESAPGNLAFHWTIGDKAKTDAAFASAPVVVRQRLVNQRLAPVAIEPRASLASYAPASDELTLYVTSQNPHVHRLIMGGFVLGLPEHKFRVIAPDVGGGFGSKIFIYPEEMVALWASKKVERPVKWTGDRTEAFLTDAHGRDHLTKAEMAFDKDNKVTGLRVKTYANLGAYMSLFSSSVPTYLYATLLSGQYNIPNIFAEVISVYTNTVPVDAYRGAGR